MYIRNYVHAVYLLVKVQCSEYKWMKKGETGRGETYFVSGVAFEVLND